MHKDLARILITQEELDKIITRMAAEIDRDYASEDKRLVLLCILKGSVVVMGELMNARFASVVRDDSTSTEI